MKKSTKNTLQSMFEQMLGVPVELGKTDNATSSDEKEIFINFIKLFEYIRKTDIELYYKFGLDLSTATAAYVTLIECTLLLKYPPSVVDIILWYIYERFDEEGKVLPYEYENGDVVHINNAKELWIYINHINQ